MDIPDVLPLKGASACPSCCCERVCVCLSLSLNMHVQTAYAQMAGSCAVDWELMSSLMPHGGIEFVLMAGATVHNNDGCLLIRERGCKSICLCTLVGLIIPESCAIAGNTNVPVSLSLFFFTSHSHYPCFPLISVSVSPCAFQTRHLHECIHFNF